MTLIDGSWGRTCSECGSGMNLRLQVSNPRCKCQQDSLVVSLDTDVSTPVHVAGAMPARIMQHRPRSAHSSGNNSSPRVNRSPSPATSPALVVAPASPIITHPSGVASVGLVSQCARCGPSDKIVLRYAKCAGMSTPPLVAMPLNNPLAVPNPLPKLVRRYYGKKQRPSRTHTRPLKVSLSLAVSTGTGGGGGGGGGGGSPSQGSGHRNWNYMHTSSANMPLSIMRQSR